MSDQGESRRDVYLLATAEGLPVPIARVREALAAEDVELIEGPDEDSFIVRADQATISVRFEARTEGLGWTPELVTGSAESHAVLRSARGFYRLAFEPSEAALPSVAVFEALWCARTLLELLPGVLLDVTAFKLHDPADVAELTELDFDIRDHICLHAVEATESDKPLWVHTHGMSKFGLRDVEVFHLGEKDLEAAELFLHELCTDLAFGQGPAPRAPLSTSEGSVFRLLPSEEARLSLFGVSAEVFAGHEARFLTVVSAEGRHSIAELLAPYHVRFDRETPEEARALREEADLLLPAFKARFQRRGLMEALTFLVRASFESHPDGERLDEDLWLEVVNWEDDRLLGKLVDGGHHTTEWRKGAQVELAEEQINALALSHNGRTLGDEEMRSMLGAERPS